MMVKVRKEIILQNSRCVFFIVILNSEVNPDSILALVLLMNLTTYKTHVGLFNIEIFFQSSDSMQVFAAFPLMYMNIARVYSSVEK